MEGKDIRFKCDSLKKPVPIWLIGDKITITNKKEEVITLGGGFTEITLCLAEFDCLQMNSIFNCDFGSLTIRNTFEDYDKGRNNNRITATLMLFLKGDLKESQPKVNKFLKRLLVVMGLAQGDKVSYPIEELYCSGNIRTIFHCQEPPASQFMPIIQHKEDLGKLVSKVIEKQGLGDDKWTEIIKSINFILSAPNYSKARLLLNLITI